MIIANDINDSKIPIPKCCDNCGNCIYLGEGDYICSENDVIVMEDHSPNDNYNYCNACDWEAE